MSETIRTSDKALLLVTHDRAFMEETCTSILELDDGQGYVHQISGPGSYSRFVLRRAERQQAQAAAAQDAKVSSCLHSELACLTHCRV
jgi:ABC transport system ATP-binding/permease protein